MRTTPRTPAHHAAHPVTNSASYAAGLNAGRLWVETLATFAELEALERDRHALDVADSPFLAGFADGARIASSQLTDETYATA